MTAALVALDGTQLLVALITAISVSAPTLVVQRKVHRDNRADHHDTAAKVDQLIESQIEQVAAQRETAADVRVIRGDVRELRESDRQLAARLDEHIATAGDQP